MKIRRLPAHTQTMKLRTSQNLVQNEANTYRIPTLKANTYRIPTLKANTYRIPTLKANTYRIPTLKAQQYVLICGVRWSCGRASDFRLRGPGFKTTCCCFKTWAVSFTHFTLVFWKKHYSGAAMCYENAFLEESAKICTEVGQCLLKFFRRVAKKKFARKDLICINQRWRPPKINPCLKCAYLCIYLAD